MKIFEPETARISDGSYFGFAKCRVLPPRDLYHPVLPMKVKDPAGKYEKLMFPLCWTCAASECRDCTHSEDQRAMIGTWTTVELRKAVEVGYRILDAYEVWHWKETTTDLFREYVSHFLKIKQEASGWPDWVQRIGKTGTPEEHEAAKWAYIDDYERNQGIRLEYHKIRKNEGLRAMAKLCLNSLWGKFGQNPRKSQTRYIKSQKELYKLLIDDKIEEVDLNLISSEIVEATYKEKADHIPDQVSTNIAVAAFTTSHARLRLYSKLEELGEQVLYFDTDSVVYVADPLKVERGEHKTVELGDYLGDWTDELGGRKITHWVSGGPKNYGYKLDDGTVRCKIKGFSLHYENSQTLNLGSMLGVILKGLHLETEALFAQGYEALTGDLGEEEKKAADRVARYGRAVVWNDHKITREKKKGDLPAMLSKYEERVYGYTYTKRFVVPDGISAAKGTIDTLPYGWRQQPVC